MEYEAISRIFSGWPLSEVKDMTKREREYWFRCALDGKGARAAKPMQTGEVDDL